MPVSRTQHAPPTLALSDLVASWPVDRPLTALSWGGEGWSFVAEPTAVLRVDVADPRPAAATGSNLVCEFLDPRTGTSLTPPVGLTGNPLVDLDQILTAMRPGITLPGRRFSGGWIGTLSYALGQLIEPRAADGAARNRSESEKWPLLEFHFCPDGFLLDHASGQVIWIGDPARRPTLWRSQSQPCETPDGCKSLISSSDYQAGVRRILDHIERGDIYQANLTHRLTGSFRGSTRSAFLALQQASQPWYGAYLELAPQQNTPLQRRALLSMSPELFLDIDPQPSGPARITTRPMKGTRPASGDPDELEANTKDRAELNMIVDLMRNDLGRICQPGTVLVDKHRTVERHGAANPLEGGVLQATATISGLLRPGTDFSAILKATFPPGSVTGAPKIRAMQIIDDLEVVPRGPYCGAIGWITSPTDGEDQVRASFNVAIRTAMVSGNAPVDSPARDQIESGVLEYSIGAGIVADSDPEAEWQETLDKAWLLQAIPDSAHPDNADTETAG